MELNRNDNNVVIFYWKEKNQMKIECNSRCKRLKSIWLKELIITTENIPPRDTANMSTEQRAIVIAEEEEKEKNELNNNGNRDSELL